MGGSSTTELRKYKRVSLRVPIECLGLKISILGRAENLSLQGLLIRSGQTFVPDEEVTVALSLPGSTETLRLPARVAHVVPDIFMGLEFLELPAEVRERLERFIAATAAVPSKRA